MPLSTSSSFAAAEAQVTTRDAEGHTSSAAKPQTAIRLWLVGLSMRVQRSPS